MLRIDLPLSCILPVQKLHGHDRRFQHFIVPCMIMSSAEHTSQDRLTGVGHD